MRLPAEMDAMAAYLSGRRDDAVLDGLAEELFVILDGGPWPTRAQLRRELRNRFIRYAGYEIEAATSWDRACQLAKRVSDFEKRWQSSWQHFSRVPRTADTVDALLWQARQYGRLPRSEWTLFRLP